MNRRIKILVAPNMLGFFQREFFGSLWSRHFDFEVVDPNRHYDKKQWLVWIDRYDNTDWIQKFKDQNFKIIYNYLWDSPVHDPVEIQNNVLYLRAKNWIWITEHYMYTHWGYQHKIQPTNVQYFMLMLMNLRRAHRSQALITMQKFLPASLYSYVSQGICLNDDIKDDGFNDRFFNPRWYSESSFSMVMETSTDDPLFISEKSFKPLAHKHPFLVYGSAGTLQHLRDLGFETFDHVIDESYDLMPNNSSAEINQFGDYIHSMDRLHKIVAILDDLFNLFKQDHNLFGDAESQRRLDHNHELFYNRSHVDALYENEIVNVIKQFAED